MRRKPRNGEGDQIERITPRESRSSSGGGCSRGEARRTREVLGEEREKGGSVCASRERGTVRWWDLFIVIPVLQLSSSLARPLINHSSTTHRLAKSPFLSRSRPPYRSRNLAVPLEGYLETADGPRSEERRRGRASAFIYALGFEQSSRSKVDEDRRGVEEKSRHLMRS